MSVPSSYRGKKLKASWTYYSYESSPLIIVARYEDATTKEIIPFFKDETGVWKPGAPKEKRPLYGLPTLKGVTGTAFVAEGEKCAAACHHLGLPAVTSLGGANAAHKSDWSVLTGMTRIVLIPDADAPGEKYIADVAFCLRKLAAPPIEILVMRLPGLEDGQDVVDWVKKSIPDWDEYGPLPNDRVEPMRLELLELVKDAQPVEGTTWLATIPIERPPLPPWPIDVFPETLKDFCIALAASTETPVEVACMLGLAVVATASQRNFRLHVRNEHFEPLCLWVCPALESGNRKTAVAKGVTAPLFDWELEQRDALMNQIEKAQSEAKTLNERLIFLRRQAAKAKGIELAKIETDIYETEHSIPEIPNLPQIWAQDVTPETLGTLMAANGGAMSVLSDEGGIFEILGGRYSNNIPNLDLWLQGYSGSAVRVNRGSREAVFISEALLSVGLSPQPDVLRGLATKPGFRGRGLIARFLFALPASPLGYRHLETHLIDEKVRARYYDCIRRLLDFRPLSNVERRNILSLSKEALDIWLAFSAEVEMQMREGGHLASLRDWAAKLPGVTARVAALFHLVHFESSDVISAKDMSAAVTLAECLVEHALSVFTFMGADPSIDGAVAILRWIKRKMLTTFSLRDCFYAHKHRFSRVAAIEPSIEVLAESHCIREQMTAPVPHRPSRIFDVNPEILKAVS